MPDLRQSLKDFVATANSGKYSDETTLLSKFPELQGYNVNALKDFVATANSGKYTNEDELFSKFPEFNISKKKVGMALPSADGSLVFPKIKPQRPVAESTGIKNIAPTTIVKKPTEPDEVDYFQGAFGDVLRGVDKIAPIGVGDFVDDMARSVASGYRQGKVAEEADNLLLAGTKSTPEQIQKFIDANKNASQLAPSKEMQDYTKIYEAEGKGFWGVIKGLLNNPSVIPEVLTSSIVSMATNTDALKAGAAAIGTGTAYGAGAGVAAGGVGAAPGALAGAIASVPYAFGLASSVVEMGSTFGELLNEELGDKEMTKENVKAILENPEKLQSLRNKAITRGAIIGTVDAFTGKLASGVGAKILSKSAAKSATGAATRGAVTKAAAAGSAVEALGGSAGEATARGVTGQEMDVSEIALEGIGELPGGIRSTIQARFAKPEYKVNGAKTTAAEIDNLINTMTPAELAKTKIEIKNDYEGREYKIQDKIVTSSIKEQVRQGNPELNEPSLNAITELEKELKKLEGNTTQTGKDKAAAIRGQIKNIQENQIQEEAVAEAVVAEAPELTQKRTERIAEIESIISNDDATFAEEGRRPLLPEARTELQTELQTLKTEQDAIQEQATSQVPLQPRTGSSQEMAQGQPQAGPQVVTAEGIQETISDEKSQEITGQLIDLVDNYNTALSISEGTPNERRVTTRKSNKAFKKLADFFGFQFGDRTDVNQSAKQDALSTLSTMLNQSSPQFQFANVNELINAYKEDKAKGVESSVVKSLDTLFEIKPEVSLKTQEVAPSTEVAPVVEPTVEPVEVFQPITIANIKVDPFTRDNSIDFQEDERETDSGRTSTYLSSVTVEATDQDGNLIGTITKITDEDKIFYFTAEDIDGNEINLDGFDTLGDAKKAIADSYNKYQKKEFDKAAKQKAKAKAKKEKAQTKKTVKFAKDETVQPQRTGDRTGRTEGSTIAPLKGAPTVPGVNGPDPQLVAVAEQYAKDNGIPFKRQAEYVKVDEDRAIRIADAYENMDNDPQNPKVKEAYQNLIKQTVAQYKALVDAGYKFWFIDLNIPSNVEYASSPYNAIRDMRNNKQMGVFPTTDGFGASGLTELDVNSNPLLEDTGIQWAVGGVNGPMKNVLANDLFRAVHDAFGHGLEGAGFRARGEENAWQAHVRLFNGSAIGAITTETRGQNSWVNFGPNGEKNRNAKVEDTVFAEQKIGLMPEWTWKEGLAEDMNPTEQVEPIVEEEPTAEDLSSIDELLDLDVENEDNMLKVLNALDNLDKKINKKLFGGANESMLAIPLGTVQLVVKTLKALVKGGMILRDAIKKVAADNNLSQNIIKDIINISPVQEEFNDLMSKVDELIARQKRRGVADKKIVSNIDTMIRNSEAYKNANDAQKKIMEREGRIKIGAEERRAPSIGRILGVLKDITNVSRQDKLKIISQIRQLSKDAAKDLAKEIRELASTGKITVNQAANVIARFGKVNMLSEISVSSFVDYMTKVFADAEYASKLSAAKSLKSSIASLSKNKEKNADLRELAKQFIEIDPSMVDDIDAYNDMASKIKEAVSGSSIKTQNVSLARTLDIENALEYISKTLNVQDKKMREEKAAEIQQLMGIDVSEFSYDEMVDLLKKDKPISKYNEGIVRSTINKMFNVFSAMISENIKSGEDPITGDKVDYTKEQKRIITEFMDMDLSLLEPKQALEAVDALANFLQNKSTAKMGAMLAEYKGIMGAQTAVKENLKAQTLKKYGLEWLGQLLAENTTNLNVLFERMFKGFNKGNIIQKLMGIRNVINNKAAAQKESSKKVEDYVKKFYSKLANGESFNTAYNNVERGISSFMQRTIIGSESQRREFFNTRKKLVKQSIEVLSQGNDKEKEKAKLYQQAYDKLVKDSNSIDDIKKKTDATNLDAIKYWQNSWSEKYDQLYDTALNIYNKVLGRDINYSPDRYVNLSSNTGKVDLANDQSAFLNNNDVLYQKESGVLMETTRPDSLPKGKYLDFAFDNNNANSYYEALVDIATAEPIRQVQGFLNSPLYEKVVPNSDDATILKDRIQLFINNFRNKNPYDNDSFSKFVRALDVLAEIGASMALGGVTQPLKQVIPVAVNTLVNAGDLDLSAPFDKAKNDFMSNSGYGIANRGVESQAQVQSMNKLVEEAAKSSPEKLFNLLKKGNQLYLKLFLVNADAYIARASWMTYYEKYLNDKGVNTKGIDYNTHKLNKDAADYAQSMVDRQQNVSDADLSGKIFASKAPAVKLIVKTLMPFASFRMNQASRVGSDIAVVTDKTATKEDKTIAIRSLMGYAAETLTFRLISGYIAYQLGTAALKLLDRDESEEEKEKRKNNLVKGQVTGTVTDVLSPAPIADKFVQSKVNDLAGAVQTGMNIPLEKQYNIFGESKQDYVQNMGMYGIASERASQLFELSKLAATGKYTDDFGKEKTISEKDQETLKPFIGLGFLSSIGLAPSEAGSVLRYMVKNVKKSPGKTAEEIQETEERLEEKQESRDEKLEALDNLRKRTRLKKELDVIDEKIDELQATPEEKKVISEERKEERRQKEELLIDPRTGVEYDNETELKKNNPRLYNKNFGPRSQWFKEHKDEKKVEQKLNKEISKIERKKYRSIQRNSDGTIKRSN